MASVSKRTWMYKGEKRTAWVVRYRDPATGSRPNKTFEKKKDADAYRLKVEVEIEGGVHVAPSKVPTVKEAADAYMEHAELRHRTGDITGLTLSAYAGILKLHILPTFGRLKLTEITGEAVQDWLDRKAEAGYSRQSLDHFRIGLKNIFTFAQRRKKWIKRNVVSDEPPRLMSSRKKVVIPPSIEEIRQIFETLRSKPRYARGWAWINHVTIVTLAIFTGMRAGEISGLQWKNVGFDSNVIRVRNSLSRVDGLKGPKTKAGNRDIPMSPPVRAALLQMHEVTGAHPSGYVMLSKSGAPIFPGALNQAYWHRIARLAGLVDGDGRVRYSLHSLRHATVSLLVAQNVPPVAIRDVVGHANTTVTMNVYAHLLKGDDRVPEALGAAAAMFTDAK